MSSSGCLTNFHGYEAKKNQNGRLKKTEFFNSSILNIFFKNKGWATSTPFSSFNPTNPRTNPWYFWKKLSRIGGIIQLFFTLDFFYHLECSTWNSNFERTLRIIEKNYFNCTSFNSLGILQKNPNISNTSLWRFSILYFQYGNFTVRIELYLFQ